MHYRLYHLTKQNERATNHEFADDDAAFSFAFRLMADEPIEAWQAGRIVFQLRPSVCRGSIPAK